MNNAIEPRSIKHLGQAFSITDVCFDQLVIWIFEVRGNISPLDIGRVEVVKIVYNDYLPPAL
jgi:hypothetical protein